MKAKKIAFTGIPVRDMKRRGDRELERSQGSFAAEAIESPVCWMAVVQDPEGNKIIIHKLKES